MTDTRALALALRRDVLRMTHLGKSSHIGSCLSVADILAVIYGAIARHDPAQPTDPSRDRVILSKGHAAAALHAVLAESGYFSREELWTHCSDGSRLSGHVSHVGVPGVEVSTGSLGHGLPIGVGMALNARRADEAFRVFVVLSDGECDEGSVWEAALFAGHHSLYALTAVIDYNKLQSLGTTTETLDLEPFSAKWESFGWRVLEVDGHDHAALTRALCESPEGAGRPTCVIAHTVKGNGVDFMEQSVLWHYRSPSADELTRALSVLKEAK